ncbi:hypothetical protein U1Q18_010813 [Sarracenia purpurea var. burkii]
MSSFSKEVLVYSGNIFHFPMEDMVRDGVGGAWSPSGEDAPWRHDGGGGWAEDGIADDECRGRRRWCRNEDKPSENIVLELGFESPSPHWFGSL